MATTDNPSNRHRGTVFDRVATIVFALVTGWAWCAGEWGGAVFFGLVTFVWTFTPELYRFRWE